MFFFGSFEHSKQFENLDVKLCMSASFAAFEPLMCHLLPQCTYMSRYTPLYFPVIERMHSIHRMIAYRFINARVDGRSWVDTICGHHMWTTIPYAHPPSTVRNPYFPTFTTITIYWLTTTNHQWILKVSNIDQCDYSHPLHSHMKQ